MRRFDIAPRWTVLSCCHGLRSASSASGPEPEPGIDDAGVEAPQIAPNAIPILLDKGPGFGDGSHETTQLCLQAIAAFAPRDRSGWRMLDFGSGSGILAIGAARLGAIVDAIEIDEGAIETSMGNARRNGVQDQIRYGRSLDALCAPFDLVVANILRAVLLEAAPALAALTLPAGTLVLSGLVATDVPEITARYSPWFEGRRPDVYARGDWRALSWRPIAYSP